MSPNSPFHSLLRLGIIQQRWIAFRFLSSDSREMQIVAKELRTASVPNRAGRT
jgi:hypothetical protein